MEMDVENKVTAAVVDATKVAEEKEPEPEPEKKWKGTHRGLTW